MAKQRAPQVDGLRREDVRTPVAAMVRLHALGWGTRRIAAEFGCSRNTVKRYMERGGWAPLAGASRPRTLDGLENWLTERFRRHRGNADVVRQELLAEHGISISLRTVERAVAHLRRELAAEARATVRFETPPGRQMQIDFGGVSVVIGGQAIRVFLFVATLGHSRRIFVQAFRHERQTAWLDGIEGAFRHFGGLPAEILLDNARALVAHHDAQTREVVFSERLHTFARYWGVRPRACAPYRARNQGQGRARGRLRQAQRHRRAELRELGGARGASRLVDARGSRPAHPRHDRRAAAHALRARRGDSLATD
jgi:transposase